MFKSADSVWDYHSLQIYPMYPEPRIYTTRCFEITVQLNRVQVDKHYRMQVVEINQNLICIVWMHFWRLGIENIMKYYNMDDPILITYGSFFKWVIPNTNSFEDRFGIRTPCVNFCQSRIEKSQRNRVSHSLKIS